MTRLVLKRLLVSLVVLWLVTVLVFVATLLLPGDPARAILGQQATPERISALQHQLHLDVPVWQRYFEWLGGALTGDLGTSTATQGSVNALLGDRIIASLVLLAAAACSPPRSGWRSARGARCAAAAPPTTRCPVSRW